MKLLELDKFVRSIGLNYASPHAFFLGAGASISSGIPSAASCIWEWKRSIFATNNPGLENQVGEVSLPAVRTRIDTWLNANGYAPPDVADEYGFFIDQCIPIDADRRRFFQAWIQKARPHTGYRLLCLLAEAEIARSVWTTNFDQLTARAASDYDMTVVEVGIESAERSFRQPNRGELVHVALHGDYRYDRLMNTSDELREQDSQLRLSLIEQLKHQSLVVLGYSGRDASVMEALQTAITHGDATGRLYWCGYGDEPADEVRDLLEKAASAGREAYFVPGAAFDDVMARLSLHCLKETRLDKARGIIGSVGNDELPKVPFSVAKTPPTGLIKSNAWPVSLPGEMFQFELKEWPTEAVWKTITNRPNRSDVVAVPFRQRVLALGRLDDIRGTFGDDIKGEILRVPVTERDLRYEDGATISMFRRSLVHSIADTHGLLSDARGRIWEPQPYRTEREAGQVLTVHECASLALRRIDNQFYVVLDPTVQVCGDPEPSVETVKTIRNRILGYQHNKQFNDGLNTWRKRFFQKGKPTEFDFPVNSAAFKFTIKSSPIFATTTGGRKPLTFPDKLKPLIRHEGIEVPETKLLFGAHNGRHTTDTLPLRGLSTSGPFDLQVSDRLHTELRLGVVCPRAESPMLESFLSSIEQKQVPPKGAKEEYMVEYPGFDRAYGIRFVLPKRDSQAWNYTPEPDPNKSQSEGALSLSRSIRDGVESLKAAGVNQVLIFTPTRWHQWRGFKTDKESFDLHDFVKAYCVQRGITTQFLDQDTLVRWTTFSGHRRELG